MFTFAGTSYKDGAAIPLKYVDVEAHGQNVSPGFVWKDPPVATKSFALTIIDPHPVAHHWVHWIVFDIPFNVRDLAEGASRTGRMPRSSRELRNTGGSQGYMGPDPPKGSGPHPYVATLYALNVEKLALPPDASLRLFQKAIEGKVIAELTVTATYEAQ